MKLIGRRVCIAGSAGQHVDPMLLDYAHRLVADLVRAIIAQGGLILCGVGKNPRLHDDQSQPSVIFDWTVLETVANEVREGRAEPNGSQGRLFSAVVTTKTTAQIPADRKPLWDLILDASAVFLNYIESGWTSGAIRRQRQANLSDILIVIGGGEGVEHLAREFIAQGKPVIPIDLHLGASTNDGTGGAAKLFGEMRNRPREFVRAARPEAVGALLARMETIGGSTPVESVTRAFLALVDELISPDAFYVRLLNPKVAEFNAVERYFRQVVDPVVRDFGYQPVEMGKADTTSAWMNVQIFESIHYSAVTIVDLTGVRPNCFMELGYAFGCGRKVMVTAQEGTNIPFDASPIEVRLWNDHIDDGKRIVELRDYWKRNINREPLVRTRTVI